jgi:hypothetical protein
VSLRLVQLVRENGSRFVAATNDDGVAQVLKNVTSTYELAQKALNEGASLASTAAKYSTDEQVDLDRAAAEGRIAAPIDHPDPAHLYLTGTGLTHLGSAEGRDKMHKAAAAGSLTDSMRMFLMGLEGGKPSGDAVGVQPEWFYKGNGQSLIAPGAPFPSPEFAQDGSEEPEIAAIYVIDQNGAPRRLGYCLANEFSDHVTERGNYLWLAHSKLRPASLGPELLTGELPHDVRGTSRLIRNGEKIWEKPFLTGEANMSHTLRNLEHHHFKYRIFRKPGDVHVHFFGTATLSFSDGVKTEAGDVFEIEAPPFSMPLRNALGGSAAPAVSIKAL